jgi:voltage-gated potassium channel Kch
MSVAPTIVTYTATSTYTTTSTTTVIGTNAPISRGPTSSRAVSGAATLPSGAVSSAAPNSQPTGGINLTFVLKGGEHAGLPAVIRDG